MHILAAYVPSPHSQFMLDSLRQLPGANEIDLSLARVSAFPALTDGSAVTLASYEVEFVRPQREAEERQLQEVAESIGDDFRSVRTHILHGSEGTEIIELGEREKVDLIVCGAIGQSALARVLLGSVSDSIATGAACSTLVIRPPASSPPPASEATSEASQLPAASIPKRVLIGVGNAESDGRLTDWVRRLSLPTETAIDLVYVMETRPVYEIGPLGKASAYWKEVRSMAAQHIEKMSTELKEAGYRVDSDLIDAPHIGAALVEHAKQNDCDLVIVGDQRETIVARMLIGSTSRHVLRYAPCNVLISRQ